MTKKFNASMFDKIKDALKKSEKNTSSAFSNIMKFPAGHTYTLRLIPNIENIDDTFFHHYVNQWSSKKDGSFISALSLKTFGERDPINEVRWRLYKDWKDSNPNTTERFENPIKEREQWFVNIYVIDDPSNPENNGKVKILNVGPQIKEIIDEAMVGDRSDEFGASIFDLSKDGCDLKIKAEKQGVFTTFKGSFFTSKTRFDLSDDEVEKIYESTHDLKQIHPTKTFDELQDLLNDHFFSEEVVPVKEERKPLPKISQESSPSPKKSLPIVEEDPDDEIPMFHDTDKDSDIDSLLEGLEID